jgi:hypothetical protein
VLAAIAIHTGCSPLFFSAGPVGGDNGCRWAAH